MIAEVLVICYSFIVMKKSFLILVLAVAVAAFNPAQTAAQTGTQAAAQTAAQIGAQTAALSIRDVPYVDLYSNASREVTPDEIYQKNLFG